jgi:bis(5'-nucleosidyl)-tetraphosphatase
MHQDVISAGVLVLRPAGSGWRTLVLRQYRNWDLPKGLVDDGEDTLSAARREVKEETGLDDLYFVWGVDALDTAPYNGGKVARIYFAVSREGEASLPVSPELGRPEHHEFRWVALDEARRLLPTRFHPMLDRAATLIAPPTRPPDAPA